MHQSSGLTVTHSTHLALAQPTRTNTTDPNLISNPYHNFKKHGR